MSAEVHGLIPQVKAKKSRVMEWQKYIENAETSLMSVKMQIEEGESHKYQVNWTSNLRKEEVKEKEMKTYKIESQIEEEQKSLEWKQTVRVGVIN